MHLLIELTLMPLVAFLVGLMMVLMMRRIAARLQRRVGPPFFQPLYDIVKLHSKRTQVSHGMIHDIGIVMAMGGYIAAETLLPVPGMHGIAGQEDLWRTPCQGYIEPCFLQGGTKFLCRGLVHVLLHARALIRLETRARRNQVAQQDVLLQSG